MKTYNEILEILKEKIDKVDHFAYGDYHEEDLDLGKVVEVEQEGGEGEGSNWYSVQHFVEHDIYIKVSGYYQSYNGTDFDDWDSACRQVRPKEKTITIYE